MPASAIEQIYDKLAEVFGGTNPNQHFTMLMPGTILNPDDFCYDLHGFKPETVREAEGRLVDQMFDIAKVSAGSNGRRVSSQFVEALRILVPDGNALMPQIKNGLRAFLNQPVPEGVLFEGQPYQGNLNGYYFMLYNKYVKLRTSWEQEIFDKRKELEDQGEGAREAFMEWYESVAEGRLAMIEAARSEVIAVCAPADMDAVMAALESGPSGGTELEEAMTTVRNARLASSDGGYFFPVEFTPSDWFLSLHSDSNPADMLADPKFIAASIKTKREALEASLAQLQALLATVPSDAALKQATDDFAKAQEAHGMAQQAVMNTSGDAVGLAAEMYLKAEYPFASAFEEGMKAKPEITDDKAADVKQKAISVAEAMAPELVDEISGRPFSPDDVKQIVEQQKKCIEAQFALEDSALHLADAARDCAELKAARFSAVGPMIARVSQQLQDIRLAQDEMGRAALAAGHRKELKLAPTPSAGSSVEAEKKMALEGLEAVKKLAEADRTRAKALTAFQSKAGPAEGSVGKKAESYIADHDKISATAVGDMVDKLNLMTLNGAAAKAREAAIVALNPTVKLTAADTLATRIDAAKVAIKDMAGKRKVISALEDVAGTSYAHFEDLLEDFVRLLPDSKADNKKSDISPRFMELQFSFTSSEVSQTTESASYASQSRTSGCGFFGSGGRTSSTSVATSASNSLEQNTEIKIAFKATKVEIARPWLDPSIFSVTRSMSKTSSSVISHGSLPYKADRSGLIDWDAINAPGGHNDALFPAIPTAFLIVKDVDIIFSATESQLQAVHSHVESRSAGGGGFFCFSSSASSSSSSDNQAMKSRSEGRNIHIRMAAPQIMGWFLALTPKDEAKKMTTTSSGKVEDDGQISILDYVRQLEVWGSKDKVLEVSAAD